MQTMPAFVYLIPAPILFRAGVVPGIVATIIFAMAPGVRLTELGIRSVDQKVVEAGQAFGTSPWHILRQVQLPWPPRPSWPASTRSSCFRPPWSSSPAWSKRAVSARRSSLASTASIFLLGFEAGLAVVILAIFLARITASLGSTESTGYFGSIRRSRPAAAHRAAGQADPRPTDPASFTDAPASVQQYGFRRTHHESTPVTHSR